VIDYNIKSFEHLVFVINGEKIWAHWVVLCHNTNVMLPVTQIAFAIVVLMKAEYKHKSFNLFLFLLI
jgi:hypothetical protein